MSALKQVWIVALVLVLSLANAAENGAVVHLFQKGELVQNYDAMVSSLQSGDVLAFDDGSLYEVQKMLDRGYTTRLLQAKPLNVKGRVPNSVALRIPSERSDFVAPSGHRIPRQEYINSTIDGYPPLKSAKIRTVNVFQYEHGEYVAVELIDTSMSMKRFFHEHSRLDPEYRKKAEDALEHFARSTSEFDRIGDFEPGQVFYNEKDGEWILADWTNRHVRASTASRGSELFAASGLSSGEVELFNRLRAAIADQRTKGSAKGCFWKMLKNIIP